MPTSSLALLRCLRTLDPSANGLLGSSPTPPRTRSTSPAMRSRRHPRSPRCMPSTSPPTLFASHSACALLARTRRRPRPLPQCYLWHHPPVDRRRPRRISPPPILLDHSHKLQPLLRRDSHRDHYHMEPEGAVSLGQPAVRGSRNWKPDLLAGARFVE